MSQCHPPLAIGASCIRRIWSPMVRPLPGLVPQPMCGSVQAPSQPRVSSPKLPMAWPGHGDGHKRTASPSFSQSWKRLDLEFISHPRTLNCLSFFQDPQPNPPKQIRFTHTKQTQPNRQYAFLNSPRRCRPHGDGTSSSRLTHIFLPPSANLPTIRPKRPPPPRPPASACPRVPPTLQP